MDRERRKLESEEKKIIAKIKACHKKGDEASARIYGKLFVFGVPDKRVASCSWRFDLLLVQWCL